MKLTYFVLVVFRQRADIVCTGDGIRRGIFIGPGDVVFSLFFVLVELLFKIRVRVGDIFRRGVHHLFRNAVEAFVGEQFGCLFEVEDGEPQLAVAFINAGTAADDLLEFGHRLNVLVQHHQFAGLCVDAGGHQLGGGGDNRIGFFGVNKVIQLCFADVVIAGDFHHILVVLLDLFRVEIDQRAAHPLRVIDVVTEDDGFIHRVGAFEVIGNGFGHQFGTLINHHRAIKIFLVVDTVVDQLAVFICLAFGRAPSLKIDIDIDAHHFIRGKEAVFDAFFQ
ncbi:hypothetical protein CDS [Salmonella enterica subsp. enterica serovar Derby]|nr:hypothetical protein CDS [Salmonella enterica subsp. enterica serovar Derby]